MALIQSWVLEFPDLQSLEAALTKAKLVMGVVRSVTEAGATTWAKERGAVVEVSDRGGGTLKLPNSPWRFSKADTGVRGEPLIAASTIARCCATGCRLDDARFVALEEQQVLSARLPRSG